MDTCIVETGLLRKKPCGHASVTKCANCEVPLCAQHAVAQLTAAGKRSGAFLCPECDAAQRAHAKSMAAIAKSAAASPPPAKKAPAPAKAPEGKDAPPASSSDQIADTIEYKPEPKKK